MNILLTSIGRRGYLVKYFKEALGAAGKVFGADNSPCSAAFAYCDGTAILPRVQKDHYPEALLEICRENNIDIVIPLIDPELEVLAPLQGLFKTEGILLLVSPPETIELALSNFTNAARGTLALQTVNVLDDDVHWYSPLHYYRFDAAGALLLHIGQ